MADMVFFFLLFFCGRRRQVRQISVINATWSFAGANQSMQYFKRLYLMFQIFYIENR